MMRPTLEQHAVGWLFDQGESMVVEAGAGTGKTTTLQQLAEGTTRPGRYLAFNKAIVSDVEDKLPPNVGASTAHALAFRAVGKHYQHRLGSQRMKSRDIARQLGIHAQTFRAEGRPRKHLSEGYLGGLVMRAITRFCQTADAEPSPDHMPFVHGIDPPGAQGAAAENNLLLGLELADALAAAWADLSDRDGSLTFRHEHYLKLYQLGNPRIDADFVLFDEAQDANPVMAAIVGAQEHAQVVWVGDANQAIYEWTGAINSIAERKAAGLACRQLTQSFRFGPEIAAAANTVLEELGADLRLRGREDLPGSLGRIAEPDAILCRTNAQAVTEILFAQREGKAAHLVGGGDEVIAFAKAAAQLKRGEMCWHPELACFDSWPEVQAYCLAPGTRLLTEDLRWQPIELLAEGDRLVGFDEHSAPGNGGRRFRTTTVQAARPLIRPARRIWMEDGREVVASTEHRWLVRSGAHALRWKQTEWLRPGDEIATLGMPWEAEESREAGWLSGMFDGEGWTSRRGLGISQNEGPVLERVRAGLKERGVGFTESENDHACRRLLIGGSLADRLRLLGTLRPERLVAKAAQLYEGVRVETRAPRAVVRGVEHLGEQEVIAITTDSATFIAEGLLSHNCREDAQGGELRLLVSLVDEFGVPTILSALELMPEEESAELVVSTAHKAKGREWDAVRIAPDFADGDDLDEAELRLRYVAITRARRALDMLSLQEKEPQP